MLKRLSGALIVLLITAASAAAQTCSTTLPNNITNGTNADASAVMGNFNSLQTCVAGVAAPSSWTPALTFGGSSTGITYSVQSGTYAQIGKMVLAEAHITLTSKGTATGVANITGLPVISGSYVGIVTVPYYGNFASLSGTLNGYVTTNSQTAVLTLPGSTGHLTVNNANFTNTSSFFFAVFYIAQ
jgi:hypothetical protein